MSQPPSTANQLAGMLLYVMLATPCAAAGYGIIWLTGGLVDHYSQLPPFWQGRGEYLLVLCLVIAIGSLVLPIFPTLLLCRIWRAKHPQPSPQKKKAQAQIDQSIDIAGIRIICGQSTTAIFDGSPYFVEYEQQVAPEGVPFVTCLIRERRDPEHVVGDIGIQDEDYHPVEPLPEEELRRRPIVGGCELNERFPLHS